MITFIIVILSLSILRGLGGYFNIELTGADLIGAYIGNTLYLASLIIAIIFAANLY